MKDFDIRFDSNLELLRTQFDESREKDYLTDEDYENAFDEYCYENFMQTMMDEERELQEETNL